MCVDPLPSRDRSRLRLASTLGESLPRDDEQVHVLAVLRLKRGRERGVGSAVYIRRRLRAIRRQHRRRRESIARAAAGRRSKPYLRESERPRTA